MAVVSKEKRGRYVFHLCSVVSCSWDVLRKKQGQQKVSALQHSHRWLASWGLLTIFLLPLGIFSVCFQSGDLKLVLFGVSILKVPLIFWEMCWKCGSITRKVIYCSEMGTPTLSCKGTLAAAAVGADLAFKPAAEDVQMRQRRLEHGQQHLLGSSDKCWGGWVVLNHILLKLF